MQKFQIGNRTVGLGEKCFVVAEVAQSHDGSLGLAHAFIDAAAHAGADAIKFQTHFADQESTLDEEFRVNFSYQDKNRYEYWRRMEFTESQWIELAKHAQDRNIIFLSSAFSVQAVEMLDKIGMPAWKIGSGEIYSDHLIARMKETKKPLLLSSGMSDKLFINQRVTKLINAQVPVGLFQCTTKYPTPLEEVGLNILEEFKQEFDIPVGLSDHSGSIFPSLVAIARNADMLEVHFTFNKDMFGPDVIASITIDELSKICELRDATHLMNMSPVDKNEMSRSLDSTRKIFGKSVSPRYDIPAGTVLTEEMLTFKKPAIGIPENELEKVIGKITKRDLAFNKLIRWDDLNP